uniref:Small ribosomal subunit protein uS14c n=1 Tax=Picocystis salinarum TaxID=88271 RepID=A0A088CIE7_9CHLO|nr:ribosomal protein S14 [Picocystis salinarum]AID67643.1 ribosomal protein S14 [Picocystis salinarum]
MAKKSMIARDAKRQSLVQKYAKKRRNLKKELLEAVSLEEKFLLQHALQKLPRNSAPVRLHNRCAVTGRPKAFYRHFGVCRHVLRELAHNGHLPGVQKASW